MGLLGRVFGGRIFAQRQVAEPIYPAARRVPFSGRTLAGVRITPDTAITVPTVWACLRCISQTAAVLPWGVKVKSDTGRSSADTHPINYLIGTEPNPEWTSFQFRETLTHWALRWGNGYAEIERDQLGRPIALWPIHPERVLPKRDDSGTLYYRIINFYGATTADQKEVDLPAKDMFHLRGFGEGPVGVNVMDYAAESIGWAKAAQLFGASFFGSGMNLTGVIESDKPLDDKGIIRLRAMISRIYKGIRGERLGILDNGQKFKSVQIEPDKAQFLGTNQHLVEEICRWFGVPPHKVMHLLRSTNNNIEHQGIEFAVDTMTPWVRRWEQEADRKLFGANRPGYYTKMNMNALMRADAAARAAFYKTMSETGAYSPNMILELEDENTIGPSGDKHLVQLNLTTLDKVGEAPPKPAAPPAPIPDKAAQAALHRLNALVGEPAYVA